eukprot:TRINITY_DN1460_c0_g4_i1.p1 TRINITY_DN1460_c0_g4~~TRINITY_DN1460_c0_g4_i1.p1  ORF type:complete len:324 (+),score=22.43 TRINITY_DN1460_c0_g4_i1:75-974(+)
MIQVATFFRKSNFRSITTCPYLQQNRCYQRQCNIQLTKFNNLQQNKKQKLQANAKTGLGEEDVDVSVFRFTLGIPGFEDRFLSRIIGGIGLVLMTINHLFGAGVDEAQIRTEVIISFLSIMCIVAPTLEQRLLEFQPGQGRKEAAVTIQGAVNAFAIDESLTDKQKQELAWASFALLKNTNSCTVYILGKDSQILLARGAVSDVAANLSGQQILNKLNQISQNRRKYQLQQQLCTQDKASTQSSWIANTKLLAAGILSVVVEPIPNGGCLIVLSERARAFQERDRKWVQSIASKLNYAL